MQLATWKNSVKMLLISLIAVCLVFFGSGAVFAVGESSKPKDCPLSKRFENWGNFINSVVGTGGFDDFLEYWKDIFVRNFCHQYDIDILERKLDKTRKQIRKAFYTCKNDKAHKLSDTYNKLYLELTYLRKFIKYEGGEIIRNFDVDAEMKKTFVDERQWFSPDEFWGFYGSVKAKYDFEKYRDCKDDVWAELIEKWGEFKEVMTESAKGLVSSKKYSDRWKKINFSNDPRFAPPGKTGGFFSGRVGFYLNDMPPKYGKGFFSGLFSEEELSEIGDETLKNVPLVGTAALDDKAKEKIEELNKKTVSVYEYIDAVSKADSEHFKKVAIAELIADYTFLYKDAGESVIDALVSKLNRETFCDRNANRTDPVKCKKGPPSGASSGFLDIIKDTLPILEEVKACSTQIRDRQCTNK